MFIEIMCNFFVMCVSHDVQCIKFRSAPFLLFCIKFSFSCRCHYPTFPYFRLLFTEFVGTGNTNQISRWLNVQQISSPLRRNARKYNINEPFCCKRKIFHRLTFSYSDSDLNSFSKSATFFLEMKNNVGFIKARSMSSDFSIRCKH